MKLGDLKDLIHAELIILNHSDFVKYEVVNTYSLLFESMKDMEITDIRAKKDKLVISVR